MSLREWCTTMMCVAIETCMTAQLGIEAVCVLVSVCIACFVNRKQQLALMLAAHEDLVCEHGT